MPILIMRRNHHASLIKAYAEGVYPYGDYKSPQTAAGDKGKPKTKRKKKAKKEDNNTQLELFNE